MGNGAAKGRFFLQHLSAFEHLPARPSVLQRALLTDVYVSVDSC